MKGLLGVWAAFAAAVSTFGRDFRAGRERARSRAKAARVQSDPGVIARARMRAASRAWAANNEGLPFYAEATARRLPVEFFWKRDALPGANLAAWPGDRYAWRIYRAGVSQ